MHAKLANAIMGRLTNLAVLQLRHFTVGHDSREPDHFGAFVSVSVPILLGAG
jgi:hypothetical protein